jgi:hypothetical protein
LALTKRKFSLKVIPTGSSGLLIDSSPSSEISSLALIVAKTESDAAYTGGREGEADDSGESGAREDID